MPHATAEWHASSLARCAWLTGDDSGEGGSVLKHLLDWTASDPLSNPATQGLAWVLIIMRPLLFSFLLVRVLDRHGQASHAGLGK